MKYSLFCDIIPNISYAEMQIKKACQANSVGNKNKIYSLKSALTDTKSDFLNQIFTNDLFNMFLKVNSIYLMFIWK